VSTRARRAALATAVTAGALSCAAHQARFERPDIVWRVSDDAHIAEPEVDLYNRYTHYADALVFGRVDRALSLPDEEPARDTNALDEVPDSSWFENRVGRYELTPDDIASGPGVRLPVLPVTVVKGKADGSNPGFVVKDATGERYLLKLDPKVTPELQTSTAAIASRLFWALGYHVPSEDVTHVGLDDIRIGKDAVYEDALEEEHPITPAYLEGLLALGPPPKDGKYRVLASRFLAGKPKGGFKERGVRRDDPNDTIPHEHRRSIRALRVFCAWLDHTDFNPQNTLDMYVTEGKRSYLKHHVIDFGEMLGAHALEHPWVSYAYFFDETYFFPSMFTFGLWTRPWENEPPPPFPTVGRYFPDFDPTAWKEAKPYSTFRDMTKADAFWAAKIVLRMERPLLEAAVARGKHSDPRAARYLVDTLDARRVAVGNAWVRDTTALDRFSVEGDRLCAVDLSVVHRLASGGVVERIESGEVVETAGIGPAGKVCVRGSRDRRYEVLTLRTRRGAEVYDPIEVHVARTPALRVRGVVRE